MKKYSSSKDLNAEIRRLTKQGWIFERRKKHGRLFHFCGGPFVTVSTTPSDSRGIKNLRAETSRIERNLVEVR